MNAMADADNPTEMIADMGRRARDAARALAGLPTDIKAAGLRAAATRLRAAEAEILAANARDMAAGAASGLTAAHAGVIATRPATPR